MSEIHLFPVPSPVGSDPETFRRLAAVLVNAVGSGADLGPRGHQIGLLREAISGNLCDLVEAVVPMVDALSDDDPHRRALKENVECFVLSIRTVLGAVDRLSAPAAA